MYTKKTLGFLLCVLCAISLHAQSPNLQEENPSVPIDLFLLNHQQLDVCRNGDTIRLLPVFSPIDSELPVNWVSSNPKVATVDSTGKVAPVGGGTVIITATTGTPGKMFFATCNVNVGLDQPTFIIQKWNNTLILNNNPQTNGGYQFLENSYQWYKDGTPIPGATTQTYSVGNNETDLLTPGSSYSVTMLNKDSILYYTCPYIMSNIRMQHAKVLAYPNPIEKGGIIKVLADMPEEQWTEASILVVNIHGYVIKKIPVKAAITDVTMPVESGYYILKISFRDQTNKEFKILVK